VVSMILSASPGSSYRRSNNCRLGVQSERELVSSLLRSLRCRICSPVGTRERFALFPFLSNVILNVGGFGGPSGPLPKAKREATPVRAALLGDQAS